MTGPTTAARHREAPRNPPHEKTTLEPPTTVDKTPSPAPSQCEDPNGGQTPVELPTSRGAEVEPTTPVKLPAAVEAEVEPKGQTGPERAHHLETLHGKLCPTLYKKARSGPGAPPSGPTNAPQPWACRKPKPSVAVNAGLQPPRTARQAKPAAPVNAAAPTSTRTTPETENPGWLDFLPKFSPRDHDPTRMSLPGGFPSCSWASAPRCCTPSPLQGNPCAPWATLHSLEPRP